MEITKTKCYEMPVFGGGLVRGASVQQDVDVIKRVLSILPETIETHSIVDWLIDKRRVTHTCIIMLCGIINYMG